MQQHQFRLKIDVHHASYEFEGDAAQTTEAFGLASTWLIFLTNSSEGGVILPKLDLLLTRTESLMATAAELNEKLDRIDAATNKVAADVRALAAQIGTGMTQAEVDVAVAKAEALASALEGLDAQTPDVPPTP